MVSNIDHFKSPFKVMKTYFAVLRCERFSFSCMKRYLTKACVDWLDVKSHLWRLPRVVFLSLRTDIYLHQNTLLLSGLCLRFKESGPQEKVLASA